MQELVLSLLLNLWIIIRMRYWDWLSFLITILMNPLSLNIILLWLNLAADFVPYFCSISVRNILEPSQPNPPSIILVKAYADLSLSTSIHNTLLRVSLLFLSKDLYLALLIDLIFLKSSQLYSKFWIDQRCKFIHPFMRVESFYFYKCNAFNHI